MSLKAGCNITVSTRDAQQNSNQRHTSTTRFQTHTKACIHTEIRITIHCRHIHYTFFSSDLCLKTFASNIIPPPLPPRPTSPGTSYSPKGFPPFCSLPPILCCSSAALSISLLFVYPPLVMPPIAVPTGERPLLRALPRGSPRGARRPTISSQIPAWKERERTVEWVEEGKRERFRKR